MEKKVDKIYNRKAHQFFMPRPPLRDRLGMPGKNNKGNWVYEWDEEKQKHVKKWVEKE